MNARWTHKRVAGQIEPTMRVILKAGTAGMGKELGAVQCWMNSNKSMEEADRYCRQIEEDARRAGYTILPDKDAF